MTKIVNLDELAAAPRFLTYKGENYEVLDLDVESFIGFQKEFDQLLKAQEAGDVASSMNIAKSILKRCSPTFPDPSKLNLRQLMAAVQLVSDFYPDPDPTPASEAPASAEGNG